jgi:3-hydroxypropanoate dehydrogenase
MATRLDETALKQLFLDARTLRAWQPRDVPDGVLREIVDLMKMGPTANNSLPARVIFVKSVAAKERLKPFLTPGNLERTMTAPVTAIIGYDLDFHQHRPSGEEPLKGFDDKPDQAQVVAFRSGTLGGAYFILAARALGLDCGPMSGFDNAGVDREFFAGTKTKSNFLCNIGYGDHASLRPRAGRFTFNELAKII